MSYVWPAKNSLDLKPRLSNPGAVHADLTDFELEIGRARRLYIRSWGPAAARAQGSNVLINTAQYIYTLNLSGHQIGPQFWGLGPPTGD